MIEKIIAWSGRHAYIIIAAMILVSSYGVYAMVNVPVDVIPDLSEKQVIVFSEWKGQSPSLVEDQLTYPLSSTLQSLAEVKVVRAYSMYGMSFVFVVFEDNTDTYFARNRVQEKLGEVASLLPPDANVTMGPDGTGTGHIFWYTLRAENSDLGELRAIQDWLVRYKISSVKGVAEVASIGGYVRQYQIDIHPDKMRAMDVSVQDVVRAVMKNNNEVGGKILTHSGAEYFIRGQGYLKGKEDIENIPVKVSREGIPVLIKRIASVQLGGDSRRGALEENGQGEVVGGIVVMRDGENAAEVIARVKEKIKEIEPSLPQGVSLHVAYDRSRLINEAERTLHRSLLEAVIIVSLVVMIFIFHARSIVRVLIEIPVSVLLTYILMDLFDITSNIMSLGGIILAIGVIVDASIVLVENAYRNAALIDGKLTKQDHRNIAIFSAKQVGRSIFYSELIIIGSFLPVFFLSGEEGKLFTPLAFTKTFAMVASTVIVLTLIPALMVLFSGGKFRRDHENIVMKYFNKIYLPLIHRALQYKKFVIAVSAMVLLSAIPVALRIGSEFMPSLDEQSILYMPVTTANISVPEALKLMQRQDEIISNVPEVSNVLGKVGRAETATDNAPVSMIETIILLKPKEAWRVGITKKDIINELNQKLQIPGVRNGWTQPIINRINMLATGVRTDVGLKIFGDDLDTLEMLATRAEKIIRGVEGAVDVVAERLQSGYDLNIVPKKNAIARYGLDIEDVQQVIETAVGGKNIETLLEGRMRFPVRIRYAQEHRSDVESLKSLVVSVDRKIEALREDEGSDATSLFTDYNMSQKIYIPLSYLADISIQESPAMIASEDGLLRSTVVFNVRGKDLGNTVEDVKKEVERNLDVPQGYTIGWSGRYEKKQKADQTLLIIAPILLLFIFFMLYAARKDVIEAFIVFFSAPFSLVGGIYMIFLMGYNFSVAVWVGFIGLYGVAVETGVVMLVYLKEALDKKIYYAQEKNSRIDIKDIYDATIEGSVMRLRPKLMTVLTAIASLVPVMVSTGVGSDVMKPLVAPMIGGLITSTVHVLIVIPIFFMIAKTYLLKKGRLNTTTYQPITMYKK